MDTDLTRLLSQYDGQRRKRKKTHVHELSVENAHIYKNWRRQLARSATKELGDNQMDQIATLEAEEQAAYALLREASKRKQELMRQLDEQARINAELRRQEVAAKVAEARKKRGALDVSYERLRASLVGQNLRMVYVHKDVLGLLKAAVPAVSEEQFYQLLSALAEHLAFSRQQVKPVVATLRENSEYARYFNESQDSIGVPIILKNGGGTETVGEALTAYALSWGSAVEYEDVS